MIVPVLVAGAGMASESALPEALRPIARYQAIQIHDDRFDDGVEQLASVLRTVPGLTSFDLNGEWTADRERTDAFAIRRRLRPFSCSFILFVVDDLIRGSVTRREMRSSRTAPSSVGESISALPMWHSSRKSGRRSASLGKP